MRLAAALLAVFILVTVATARTWHIESDGSGDAPTIQAGIDSAAVGDTILIANGTYIGVGNRDLEFNGKGVVVRSESGDPDLCVIDCESLTRGVSFQHSEDSTAVLEGLTIENGFAEDGGAIYCGSQTNPILSNCVFLQSQAGHGGGLYCDTGGSPTILDCDFIENIATAGSGGGMYSSSEAWCGRSQATTVSYAEQRAGRSSVMFKDMGRCKFPARPIS